MTPNLAGSHNRALALDAEYALKDAATSAAHKARAGQSGFRVGAAVLDSSGRIHKGCNVETSAHTAVHAEESAVAAWALEGTGEIVAAYVAGPDGEPIAPCGMCRQLLLETAPRAFLLGSSVPVAVADLLPGGFLLPATDTATDQA